MFTGLIEELGEISALRRSGGIMRLEVAADDIEEQPGAFVHAHIGSALVPRELRLGDEANKYAHHDYEDGNCHDQLDYGERLPSIVPGRSHGLLISRA